MHVFAWGSWFCTLFHSRPSTYLLSSDTLLYLVSPTVTFCYPQTGTFFPSCFNWNPPFTMSLYRSICVDHIILSTCNTHILLLFCFCFSYFSSRWDGGWYCSHMLPMLSLSIYFFYLCISYHIYLCSSFVPSCLSLFILCPHDDVIEWNIFRINSKGHLWIPLTKASDAEL